MPGQVIPRGERTWLVRVPRGRNATGKRIYHNKTIHGTKRDAERYLTKVLREVHTGTFVEPSREALCLYLERWLDTTAALRVRKRTLDDYRGLLHRHIIPRLGQWRLCQLTSDLVQHAYAEMLEAGLSPRSVRYAHSVLHNALSQAVRRGYLATNPTDLVALPRSSRREMTALSPAQATHLLRALKGTKYEALWVLLLTSGMRPGEALALQWQDLVGDRIVVQRSLSRLGDGHWQFNEPKTSRSRRTIPLPSAVVRCLHAHRVRQTEMRLKSGAGWQSLDLVFANASGGPLEWRLLANRYLRPVLKRIGLSTVRPYDLRHSCATLLLAAGENPKVVSERLGHAHISLTLDTYSHVLPDMQQRAAERLDALLFSDADR